MYLTDKIIPVKSLLTYSFLQLMLLLCGAGSNSIAQVSEINGIVAEEMRNQHIVGLSVGIVRNGEVLLSRGYGMADVDARLPATDSTVYGIGSLSKHIIAVCILRLAEEGKLTIEDYVSSYYPDAPKEWGDITIRTLLNHTSGLQREPPNFDWGHSKPDSFYIKAAYKKDLEFATGKGWQYSNLGYFILADIIRKTSGYSFDLYTNLVFRIIGLEHTTTTNRSLGPLSARSYKYDENSGGARVWNGDGKERASIQVMRPSGAFSSTIRDMIKWDSIQRHGDLLSKDDWARMWQDTVRPPVKPYGRVTWYGYGWGVIKSGYGILLTHEGTAVGFKNAYWHGIDEDLSIIVFTNTAQAEPSVIARRIYNVLH
ncbi:MAG: beta-lactamase [Flavipsychrobacter sp.]|jgi:CubicO group peptidase (beta-lactamase class C family)|nr:beta-lactamase [Flavipsychrobacter sp.]